MTDDTKHRNGNRWYDSTRVIYLLMTVIGFLLGLWVDDTRDSVDRNRDNLLLLEDKTSNQIESLSRTINAHLSDPGIHHAGVSNLTTRLDTLLDRVAEVRAEQKLMQTTQSQMKTDFEIIKRKIGD